MHQFVQNKIKQNKSNNKLLILWFSKYRQIRSIEINQCYFGWQFKLNSLHDIQFLIFPQLSFILFIFFFFHSLVFFSIFLFLYSSIIPFIIIFQMKEYISSFILYCLLLQFATPSFFNFGYFCQTKPNDQYSGSFIYGNKQSSPDYFNIKPNKQQQLNYPNQSNNLQSLNIFQPNSFQNSNQKQNFQKEHQKKIKPIECNNDKLKMFPIQPYISKEKLKQIQQSQKQGLRALLGVVNITKQKLQYYYIHNIIQQANKLDQVLIYRVRLLQQLPNILITLKSVILNLIEHQLRDVNSVIIGERNKVIGHKIFLKGNDLNVKANESLILNSKSKKKTINGNNILRIRNYEIYLNEVEDVEQNINACIVYLPPEKNKN